MTTTPGHGPSPAGDARWAGISPIVTSAMEATLSVELGEPLGLFGHFSAYGRRQPGELRGDHPAVDVPPGAGDRAVDRERADRLRHLGVEHLCRGRAEQLVHVGALERPVA